MQRIGFIVYVDAEPDVAYETARLELFRVINQHAPQYLPVVAHAPDSLQPYNNEEGHTQA